jgi:glycosyltransferase involved in cell wall biosynthesis
MILFVTRKYPPSVGGMQKLSYQLSKELSKHVRIKTISWGRSQIFLPFFVIWSFFYGSYIILREKVNIVLIGDCALAPLGILYKKLFGLPIIITAHGLDVTYSKYFYQYIIPPFYRRVDAIICNSQNTKNDLVIRKVHPEKCVVITPGIDVENYKYSLTDEEHQGLFTELNIQPNGRKIILYVGRLIERKGVLKFITEVLPDLRKIREDWIFLVVGEGPELSEIIKFVSSKELQKQVKCLGAIKMDDPSIKNIFAVSDIFIMPNLSLLDNPEGFGLVLLEAQASGLPIIATKNDGILDAVKNYPDVSLVGAQDWRSFREEINKWLDINENADIRKLRYEQTKNIHAWSVVIFEYLKLLTRIGDILIKRA